MEIAMGIDAAATAVRAYFSERFPDNRLPIEEKPDFSRDGRFSTCARECFSVDNLVSRIDTLGPETVWEDVADYLDSIIRAKRIKNYKLQVSPEADYSDVYFCA